MDKEQVREPRERNMTSKGHDYQVELLTKEMKRKRACLSKTIGVFEDLLRMKDIDATKKELNQLYKILSDLLETGTRLANLSTAEEKEGILMMLEAEKTSVDRVRASVEEWIQEQNREDGKSLHSQVSKRSRKSNKSDQTAGSSESKRSLKPVRPKEEVDGDEKSTIAMMSEIMRKQSTLRELVLEIEGTLIKIDDGALEQKLNLFEGAMKEMRSMAEKMIASGQLSDDETTKIKNIVEEEGEQYSRVRLAAEDKEKELRLETKSSKSYDISKINKCVNKLRVERMKEERRSQGSARSTKSGRSAGSSNKSDRSGKNEVPAEILKGQLKRITLRLENQMLHMNDLMKIKDVDMMKGELTVMEQMYDTMMSVSERVFSTAPEESGREMNETLGQLELRMFDTKKLILQWMVKMEEAEERSEISQSSRKTAASLHSSKSMNAKMAKGDDHADSKEVEKTLKEQKEELGKQKVLCMKAIETKETKGAKEKIISLDDTHQKIVTKVKKMQELLPKTEANEIAVWAEKEEDEVYKIKQWMIKNIIAEKEAILEDGAKASKTWKDMEMRETEQEVKDQVEALKKNNISQSKLDNEVEKIKRRLRKQLDLIRDLLKTNDVEMVSREMEALDKVHDDLVATASQLRVFLKPEDAGKLSSTMDSEDTEVFQMKRKVAAWREGLTIQVTTNTVPAKEEKDESVCSSEERKNTGEVEEKKVEKQGRLHKLEENKVEQRNKSEVKLKEEVERIKRRLKKQVGLVEDLKVEDNLDMVDRELETLGKIYDDLSTNASKLIRDFLNPEEAVQWSSMMDSEDTEVVRVKKQVATWRELAIRKARENDADRSVKEEKDRKEIKELRAEVEQMKRMEKEARKEEEDKVETVPEEGNEEKRESSKTKTCEGKQVAQSKNMEGGELLKLNELMVETLKLQSAPKVEIDTFAGDPLEYNYFIETFKDVVENLITDPRQRLVRLLKYTKGEAKELIKHCVYDETESCYEIALNLLKEEYGNPFHIACAHLEKLKTWPQIRANDAIGLKTLYRFLLRCVAFQKVGALDLDSPLLLRNVQLSLPVNLQDKWTGRVGKLRKKNKEEAKFRDILEFIEEEAKSQNDPIYSRTGFKERKAEPVKVNKTEVMEEDMLGKKKKCQLCKGDHEIDHCSKLKDILRKEEKKNHSSKTCLLCTKEEHDMDDCSKFAEKNAREKKEFMFANKMCFACYNQGHRAKECTNKKTCNICGKDHPTGLHEVTFKVNVVHEGGGEASMCIVPVKLKHSCLPGKEVEVYAMLDECSTGTFINEEVLKMFGDDLDEEMKRQTTIRITTATNQEGVIMESCAVTGLIVESDNKEGAVNIKLPVVYAKKELPMGDEDILKKDDVRKWEYLRSIQDAIPEAKDIPFGLLIGSNCPKALEPMQVIASEGDGPYAKRTRLGWCVVGAGRDDEGMSTKCNAIKVCKKLGSVINEAPTPNSNHQVVYQTNLKDNAISDALQSMWKTDFIERQGERKGMSKEDKKFLEIMKNNVKFTDGHYQLPLPLKTHSVQIVEKEEGRMSEVRSRMLAVKEPKTEYGHSDVPILSPSEVAEISLDVDTNAGRVIGKRKCVVMPENRSQALGKLNWCKSKMMKDKGYREEYAEFMAKLFRKGYARKVPIERLRERAWYLTHHGVRHPTKKKLRVVFHCSQEKEGISLNSRLLQGPDFMNSMLGVLLRFRKGSVALMADIEAMYYQVHVPDDDCKFMRFFWWVDGDISRQPAECEMCVHSFGAISSKNCVIFALHQTAIDHQEEFGEEAFSTLMKDFYMDDLLKSLDDELKAKELVRDVDRMCAAGGFNLTKFVCGNRKVLESIPMEKKVDGLKEIPLGGELPAESALGVKWNVQDDTFGFRVCFDTDNGSRRGCLGTISRMHDPLGIASPFLLKGKKILQKMTTKSSSWDDALDPKLAGEWAEWKKDVMLLKDMDIRRSYRKGGMKDVVSTTLHCFSDASFVGYGVACYLRLVDIAGNVEVSLVMGKARVSPLKPTTVPRLELTAATVSARIAALLRQELGIEKLETFYWIDNKIVLGYILNQTRRYRIYVTNRVQVIEEFMKEAGDVVEEKWKYVETNENPGDYASRGISPRDRMKVDLWMNGPMFLRKPEEEWRNKAPDIKIIEDDPEAFTKKKCNAVKIHGRKSPETILEVFERRISSWNRMKRAMVWVLRFIRNTKAKSNKSKRTSSNDAVNKMYSELDKAGLLVEELKEAEKKIVWLLQEKHFKEEKKNVNPSSNKRGKKSEGRFRKLNPFIDEEGILRVGGRLSNAQEDVAFRFPAIIPKGTVCTKRMVEWHHKQVAHRGKHTTVCKIREEGWWIISAGKEVGAVVFKCVRCKWLRGKFLEQMMANLPISRTTIEPPFTYCGVDLFGPMLVKEGRKEIKKYGVLFTCFSLRAVHIEVASSLETDSFIQALRRFVARRGAVREITSDNGTNLVGAENEMKKAMEEMDQEQIRSFLNEQGGDWIVWEKNTPLASHMGGVWERQIRTVKEVLTTLVKASPRKLDEEILRTVLTEAEAIVNSRPLTLENLHDPDSSPLAPNHLLTMKSKLVSPAPGVFQKNDVYCRKRWRVAQHMANCFWSRWRKEYLQLLQSRQKWTKKQRNLQTDDVVLLKEEGAGRGHWPMARVVEAHHSKDGLVRSVSLRVKDSILKRPVHKTVLLVAAGEADRAHVDKKMDHEN